MWTLALAWTLLGKYGVGMNKQTIRKRKLSSASLAKMAAGGRRASSQDKRRAGRMGWEAMIRSAVRVAQ